MTTHTRFIPILTLLPFLGFGKVIKKDQVGLSAGAYLLHDTPSKQLQSLQFG